MGLSAEDVHQLYLQKLRVNHRRQDTGYSMSDKDEQDNLGITLDRETPSPGGP